MDGSRLHQRTHGNTLAPIGKASQAASKLKDDTLAANFAAAGLSDLLRRVSDSSLDEQFAAAGMSHRIRSVRDDSFRRALPPLASMTASAIWKALRKAAAAIKKSPANLSDAERAGAALGKTLREQIWGNLQQTAFTVGQSVRKTFQEVWAAIGELASRSDLDTWEGVVRNATAAWATVRSIAESAVAWIDERAAVNPITAAFEALKASMPKSLVD